MTILSNREPRFDFECDRPQQAELKTATIYPAIRVATNDQNAKFRIKLMIRYVNPASCIPFEVDPRLLVDVELD